MEYLQDLNFLKQICKQHHQETTAKVTLLNFDETPKTNITGKVTTGSINLDGASAMQRTCSLTITLDKLHFPLVDWVLQSKIKIEIGLANNTNLYQNYPIIWFPMGIYYLTSLSISELSTAYNISIQGKDKMCQLSGDIGGIFNSTINFGEMDVINENNEIITQQIEISTIIKELVHTYGKEQYNKIFIYDLEDYAIKLMSYMGKNPIYVLLNAESQKQFQIINYIKDEKFKIYDVSGRPIELSNINEENFFIAQYNILNQQNKYQIFYLNKNKTQPIYIKKCNYGDIIGYVLTDLVYGDKLIATPGETVKSVLDKIKNKLGIYEYFYDVNGNFIFKKQDQFIEINSYLNPRVSYNKPIYSFINNELIISNSYNYDISNVKNDFTVWGERPGANNNKNLSIHMRIALDKKPIQYTSIYIDENRAKYLIQNYEKFYPLLAQETEEQRLERIQKKAIHYVASTNQYQEEFFETIEDSDYDIIKYVDWREIIYQMAQDYKKYNYVDRFAFWLQEANSEYINGQTGYERYYIDIDGFWRTLYQPDYEKVDNQENLSSSYNYKIEGTPSIIKNRSGLKINRNDQLFKQFYPNGYPVNWNVNSEFEFLEDYKCLLMFYQYTNSGMINMKLIGPNGKDISAAAMARFLLRIEEQLIVDYNDEGFSDNWYWIGNYTLQDQKTHKSTLYTLSSNWFRVFSQWQNKQEYILNENHLIVWALNYEFLYNQKGKLIKNIDELISNETYYIKPLFLSGDLNIYSANEEKQQKIEKDIQEHIENMIMKKGKKYFSISKHHTFRLLSYSLQNIIIEKNYNTKMADEDFPVYNKVMNQDSGEYEYKYVGTCQSVIDNNYKILKKLYWFAANGDDTKDYLQYKNLDTGKVEANVGSTELIRLLNFNFNEIPSRFESFHNTSWLHFQYDKNKTDYENFEVPQSIYYDITHLYKVYNNKNFEKIQTIDISGSEKNISNNSNLEDESNFILIKNYPKNSYNDDLTNLKDFSKDANQLILWAQAYNILYKRSKDIEEKTRYNRNIKENPANLIFWFDFLDTSTFSNQYSISSIGPRELVKNEQSVKAIEYLPYLENIFLDYNEKVSENEEKIQKFFKSDYVKIRETTQFFRLGQLDNNLLVMAQRGSSASEVINNYIYNHVYMTQSANLSAVPQYFLQPNTLIKLINSKDQISDKYVINKITFSLQNGGNMSIQATKMLPEVLEKQDIRKEIING